MLPDAERHDAGPYLVIFTWRRGLHVRVGRMPRRGSGPDSCDAMMPRVLLLSTRRPRRDFYVFNHDF